MIDVIVREEHLRRPVGLELGIIAAARRVNLILVGIDQVGIGMILEQSDVMEKSIWGQGIVVVHESNELAGGQVGGTIARATDVSILGPENHFDARVASEALEEGK